MVALAFYSVHKDEKKAAQLAAENARVKELLEPLIRMMFDFDHFKESDAEYQTWRQEYLERVDSEGIKYPWLRVRSDRRMPLQLIYVRNADRHEMLYDKLIELLFVEAEREAQSSTPAPLRPLFRVLLTPLRVIGEFAMLMWTVIRVKKWKICPLIKIDEQTLAEFDL